MPSREQSCNKPNISPAFQKATVQVNLLLPVLQSRWQNYGYQTLEGKSSLVASQQFYEMSLNSPPIDPLTLKVSRSPTQRPIRFPHIGKPGRRPSCLPFQAVAKHELTKAANYDDHGEIKLNNRVFNVVKNSR